MVLQDFMRLRLTYRDERGGRYSYLVLPLPVTQRMPDGLESRKTTTLCAKTTWKQRSIVPAEKSSLRGNWKLRFGAVRNRK